MAGPLGCFGGPLAGASFTASAATDFFVFFRPFLAPPPVPGSAFAGPLPADPTPESVGLAAGAEAGRAVLAVFGDEVGAAAERASFGAGAEVGAEAGRALAAAGARLEAAAGASAIAGWPLGCAESAGLRVPPFRFLDFPLGATLSPPLPRGKQSDPYCTTNEWQGKKSRSLGGRRLG